MILLNNAFHVSKELKKQKSSFKINLTDMKQSRSIDAFQ